MGFRTKSIHAGQRPDPTTGAVVTPIYQTSTYAYERLGEHRGWGYSRAENPTRDALEQNLAALEGAVHGVAFGSGVAAIQAVFSLLSAGEHAVVTADVYGGTHRLLRTVVQPGGIELSYVDTADLAAVGAALRETTKLVYLETPTNPLLKLTDIARVAALARQHGVAVCVDNTFLTPYFQRPLTAGADLVLHSTTKYLNGHSDSVGGCVVTSDDPHAARLRRYRKATGAVLAPFEAWLTLRGTKTLPMRMRQHAENASACARYLAVHPKVEAVHYPGLTSHPQYALARTQQSGFGGVVTLGLASHDAAAAFVDALQLFVLAESLGGVESLVNHPATMTHSDFTPEERRRLGVTDGLVRLSVGCEDTDDIVSDLARGLAAV